MTKISPCLWFDTQGEEAANFYVSVFKACGQTASVDSVSHYGDHGPAPKGQAMLVEFTLAGQSFQALNGGPGHPHTMAMSLSVSCKDQAELDAIWDGLIDGGQPVQCGWLTDRYGVSWQIVPAIISDLLSGDPARAQRTMAAVMTMVKLDFATLEAAAKG